MKFHVKVHSKSSASADLTRGVSQRTTLEPLLFLVYTNAMSQAVDCDLFLCTSGICLFYQHKDVGLMKKELRKNSPAIFENMENKEENIFTY